MLNYCKKYLCNIITVVCCVLNGCTGHHYEYQYSNILKTPVKNIQTTYIPYQDNSGFRFTYDFFDGKMKWKYITDITEENYKVEIDTNITKFYLSGIQWKNLYLKIENLKPLEKEVYYKVVTILTKDEYNNIVYRETKYEFLDLDKKKYNLLEVELE